MTTALTTGFAIPIPPLDTAGTADGYGTLMQTADDNISAASGRGAWVDYSATSVVTGWGVFITKSIKYKKVGNLVFVVFYINGTSNDTVANFTLPLLPVVASRCVLQVKDNGGAFQAGTADVDLAGTVNCFPDLGSTAWTAANGKSIHGQIFYEVA